MTNTAINTDNVVEKLMDISISDDPGDLIKKFCKFLAHRLNNELEPCGFALGCDLALYDISKGIDGYSKKPIQNGLVGYPPVVYKLLRMRFPAIAQEVLPKDFADEVVKIFNET